MKNFSKIFFISLSVIACTLLAACSDDEGKAPVEFSFTELKGIDTSLLEECGELTGSFEVSSTGKWHIYSDKLWVTLSFERDGEYFNDIQAVEGNYTVFVKVTGDSWVFNESQATITAVAGDRQETVATVARPAKSYGFGAVNEEGAAIESLNIGYDATAWVGFNANFDCAIISYPEWMSEPQFASGGYTLTVADDYVPARQNGEIIFGSADGQAKYALPVEYSGMDPMKIVIESDYNPWGWHVTLDGQVFTHEGDSPSGETVVTTVESKLDCRVKCLDYDCEFVMLEERDGVLYAAVDNKKVEWAKAVYNEGATGMVSVTVEPFAATVSNRSRAGYLFAVPAALYETFVTSLNANPGVEEFVDEYMSYVLLQVTQKDFEGTEGFAITNAAGENVECAAEVEHYEWLCSEFSITDVSAATLVPGESYTINTKLSPAEWAKNYGMAYLDGGSVRISRWNVNVELGEDANYCITLTVPATLDKPVVLRLYTPQIINIKALVIRPATNQ